MRCGDDSRLRAHILTNCDIGEYNELSMNIEDFRALALSFPGATEDVKWGNDLCFLVGEKMFSVTKLGGSFSASMKVETEAFDELIERQGIIPAPYLARYKWVLVKQSEALSSEEWHQYLTASYEIVKAKLPKRLPDEIDQA